MALKKYSLQTNDSHQGKRLDQVLAEWLPSALGQNVSKAKVRKLVVAGAVYLNGKRVRIASKEIRTKARIEAFVDLQKLQGNEGTSRDRPFEMTPEHVLFEDAHLIVVDKPPGLPTQPTLDEARINLFAAVKKFLARRDGVVDPYVGLHHRLDRDTSGVILFTKTKEANEGVARMFKEHDAKKIYQALCWKPRGSGPAESWVVKNYLGKIPGPGKRAKFGAVRSGGDAAETEFKCLESLSEALWVEAAPKTGRTHQIRVHLAEGGMPILGDDLYTPPALMNRGQGIPRLMLHAVRLTFPHPVHRTEISISSPIPEDFKRCLQALRKGLIS